MKKIFCTLILLFLAISSFAQTIIGTWYGVLKVQGTAIHLIFHLAKNDTAYTSTMDSPDQGAKGLAANKTDFTGNQLTIDLSKFGIKYTGAFKPDSNIITGTFMQGALRLPLNLSSKESTEVAQQPARPQDPKDFPYKQEEVTFTDTKGGNQLAGTLTMPASGHASKIVILITGSGPQNRNEELVPFNHRPFLVWADWLTRHGIAVLRYDDRGVAKSTGDFQAATTADFANDAEAAVNYIKSRNDLKGLAIGLMGHSEGGIVAPLVASRNKSVKFVVMLAGPGVPIVELMTRQTADQLKLNGVSPEIIKLSTQTNLKLYTAAIRYNNLPDDAFKLKLDSILYNDFKTYPADALGNQKPDDIVKRAVAEISSPWFRYFVTIDPASYLTKVKCPVLAIDGTLDMQVNAESNLAAIKKDLDASGNKNNTEVDLPYLNHLMQKAQTGAVSEYKTIEETVDPIALQSVSDWINKLP